MTTPNQTERSADAYAKVGAILQEFQEEKQRELKEEKGRNRPKKNPNRIKLAIVSVACVTVWIGPRYIALAPTPPSEQVIRHGVKTNLFLDGLQVKAYREQHGKLPVELAQAGVDHGDASYSRMSDSTFRLTTTLNGEVLTVSSEDNVDSALVGMPLARTR